MAEDQNIEQEQEQEDESIYEMLGIAPPDTESQHAEAIEAAEEEADREDGKALRNLSKKVEEMEKRQQREELQRLVERYESQADDLHKELFKAVKAQIKDPESMASIIQAVDKQAGEMTARMTKFEEETKAKVVAAWGGGNPAKAQTVADDDDEEEMRKRIAAGDSKAALKAIMADDTFLGGRV